jgi:hypothetical protein
MRKGSLDFYLMIVAVVVVGFMFRADGCLAQAQRQPSSRKEDSLKTFLQDYLGAPSSADDKTTRYFSGFVDLNDDGTEEVVVYLVGDGWCGSSGCTTLIVAPRGSSYKVVTKITITRPPVRVLTTKSNGWHDIAAQVQGGGIIRAYEAKLSFDGRTYPRNPSTPPARRLVGKVAGEVVVPLTGDGTPLY